MKTLTLHIAIPVGDSLTEADVMAWVKIIVDGNKLAAKTIEENAKNITGWRLT